MTTTINTSPADHHFQLDLDELFQFPHDNSDGPVMITLSCRGDIRVESSRGASVCRVRSLDGGNVVARSQPIAAGVARFMLAIGQRRVILELAGISGGLVDIKTAVEEL